MAIAGLMLPGDCVPRWNILIDLLTDGTNFLGGFWRNLGKLAHNDPRTLVYVDRDLAAVGALNN